MTMFLYLRFRYNVFYILKFPYFYFSSQDDDDIDMEPASSNPLLAAEARKESAVPKSYITPTNVSRNPFKKSTTPSTTPK